MLSFSPPSQSPIISFSFPLPIWAAISPSYFHFHIHIPERKKKEKQRNTIPTNQLTNQANRRPRVSIWEKEKKKEKKKKRNGGVTYGWYKKGSGTYVAALPLPGKLLFFLCWVPPR